MKKQTQGNNVNQIRVIIRKESCDNLLKQTIDFLHVIRDFKQQSRLQINVFIEDIKEPCCISGSNVIWGYQNIIRFLMQISPQNNTSKGHQKSPVINTNKSPYATNDVMNDTFTQIPASQNELENFQMKVLQEGDQDKSDQHDQVSRQKQVPRQHQNSHRVLQTNQQPQQQNIQMSTNHQKKQVTKTPIVQKSQTAIDDEYHSRFLDELKSGGD